MITEESRFQLHQQLEEQLGTGEAATLMEHLPPVGWADVATKRDLELTRHDLGRDIELVRRDLERQIGATGERLRTEIHGLRAEMHQELATLTRTFMTTLAFSVFGAVATSSGLAFAAAARLAG